jgi:SAF domain
MSVLPSLPIMTTERQDPQETSNPPDSGTPRIDHVGHMLILKPGDNVGVVVTAVPRGGVLRAFSGESVEAIDDIPRAHKVALSHMPKGGGVRKYGEIIGLTTRDVRPGEHVHVHNVQSQRLRGDLGDGLAGHLGARDGG